MKSAELDSKGLARGACWPRRRRGRVGRDSGGPCCGREPVTPPPAAKPYDCSSEAAR